MRHYLGDYCASCVKRRNSDFISGESNKVDRQASLQETSQKSTHLESCAAFWYKKSHNLRNIQCVVSVLIQKCIFLDPTEPPVKMLKMDQLGL